MATQYATPGVYIEEITGPGAIPGVGTSTAAFIGPTAKGPFNQARRITSLDEFIDVFGAQRQGAPWPYLYVQGRPFYLGFALQGFFDNGGQQAYVVRVGTGRRSSLTIQNQANEDAFVVSALVEGAAGDQIQVATEEAAVHEPANVTPGQIQNIDLTGANPVYTVDGADRFRVDDFVTTDGVNRAQIIGISGQNITVDAQLAGAAVNDPLNLDDIRAGTTTTFRLVSAAGLYAGGTVLIDGGGNSERATVQTVSQTTDFVTLAAAPANTYALAANPTITSIRVVAIGQSNVVGSQVVVDPATNANVTRITVADGTQFRPGDIVTSDGVSRAVVAGISGNALTLDSQLGGIGATLRIADLTPAQRTIRVADAAGLYPGTVVEISGDDAANPGTPVSEYAVVSSVAANIVTFEAQPARAATFNLDVAAGAEPTLLPREFRLVVTPPPPPAGQPQPERFEPLSLNPAHPSFVLNAGVVQSEQVSIDPPDAPPTAANYPQALVNFAAAAPLQNGQDDDPLALGALDYQGGLNVLRDVDDVNMVCIPDAAENAQRQQIQVDMITHCVNVKDRMAILDPPRGAPPSGPGSVEEQRQQVTAANGFAALYYPWLAISDPTSSGLRPRRMVIPPSGHVAGIWARTDTERGVHKPPANTDVRGVLGLERKLSDRQQGPLNLEGVNVLRIFPGDARVIVWGARTTVEPIITDWLYVNVRRLLLYIEESIAEGIRWAVFEPNDRTLWKKLERTIGDFLERVWRDGGLFGEKATDAFRVRIDEGLNPPSVRALGRLYIEIKVAPVRPAEFIVVRIGLWDGGGETSEL